jgi:hypothetical protein
MTKTDDHEKALFHALGGLAAVLPKNMLLQTVTYQPVRFDLPHRSYFSTAGDHTLDAGLEPKNVSVVFIVSSIEDLARTRAIHALGRRIAAESPELFFPLYKEEIGRLEPEKK